MQTYLLQRENYKNSRWKRLECFVILLSFMGCVVTLSGYAIENYRNMDCSISGNITRIHQAYPFWEKLYMCDSSRVCIDCGVVGNPFDDVEACAYELENTRLDARIKRRCFNEKLYLKGSVVIQPINRWEYALYFPLILLASIYGAYKEVKVVSPSVDIDTEVCDDAGG